MRVKRASVFISTIAAIATNFVGGQPCAIAQSPEVEYVLVPGTDLQVGGPTHDFRIGRFEIRNDQFAEFLNDALNNPSNERGAFMYFDTLSGDVYVNISATGSSAAGANGRTVLMYSPGASGQMTFDNGVYAAASFPTLDFSAHPVSGVTWYGALKYCNWLTIDANLPPSQRAYSEAVANDLGSWRPVTISASDWATRDLDSTERDALLAKLGYRLPMDGGVDGPGTYNEWYKAAASRTDIAGPLFDSTYGFGRDVVLPADANFSSSNDSFEPGTTPVGFYDGVNMLALGGSLTSDTDNGYGLYDLSGNVWEWVQDQEPADATQRRNRGGSWLSLATDLRATLGVDRTPTAVEATTGFRVVQSVLGALVVTPSDEVSASGPWGGPYASGSTDRVTYRLENVLPGPVSFSITTSEPWIIATPDVGIIAPRGSITVDVMLDPICADGLTVGQHDTVVSFLDNVGDVITDRAANVTVTEPLSISPPSGVVSNMRLAGAAVPANMIYTIQNSSDSDVTWTASFQETTSPPSGAPWLTVSAGDVVPAHGFGVAFVSIDQSVAATLKAGTYTANVTLVDECTGTTFVRGVTLNVVTPFSISPLSNATSVGVFGGPFVPATHEFTVDNLLGAIQLPDDSVDWTVTLCTELPGSITCTPPTLPFWLSLDSTGGLLTGSDFASITTTVTQTAETLAVGVYSVTVRVEEPATGFFVDRSVSLDVTGLLVEPDADAEFTGRFSGPFAPAQFEYGLRNTGLEEMSWQASILSYTPPLAQLNNLDWLTLAPMAGLIVDPDGVDAVTVTLTTDASLLPEGRYEANLSFSANGATAVRRVVLTIGVEAFSVEMVSVPGEDAQPFGPTYDFRIQRREITNREFAQFLNTARRNAIGNTPDERSEYIYFDTDTGDVYLNNQRSGAVGGDPVGTLPTLLFDAAISSAISMTNGEHVVLAGSEEHPAVGVSWYGAVKFCNWMTITQGMSPTQRAYFEGSTAADWVPAVEPMDIVSLRGFRLPMDGGVTVASEFSEWYKAAAWIDTTGTTAAYGFGRDALTTADANYLDSGDPFEPGATPTGFFDGSTFFADGETTTVDTQNGYGLYDMSGNVAEWVHDDGIDASQRATRGGHFNNVESSALLRNDSRGSFSANATLGFVGFRVAQAVGPTMLTLSQPANESRRVTGFVGGPYDFGDVGGLRTQFTLRIVNNGGLTVDGVTIAISPPWLEVEGVGPGQIPPGSPVDVPLVVAVAAIDAGVSPTPPEDMVLVRGDDLQTGGPTHDFWIDRAELTNAAFASFLTDARADAASTTPSVRSAFMYFDTNAGDVYINDVEAGAEGFGPPTFGPTTLLYDAQVGRIRLMANEFVVQAGFEDHPATGVTWFGAIKYCNWATLSAGIPAPLRAYDEASSSNLDGWHPVVVDDVVWTSTGLDDLARTFLVQDTLGYRLPMDAGAFLAASYNEWYKAASRGGVDANGQPTFLRRFGFGRNGPTEPVDANYFESGDTELDETTPVRFFDGANALYQPPLVGCETEASVTLTRDSDNGYGLYDATGNVSEWMQGAESAAPSMRAKRGGSWRDLATAASLRTTSRELLSPDTAADDLGFRIVRGAGHVVTVTVTDNLSGVGEVRHFILDLREPFEVTPGAGLSDSGFYGDPLAATGGLLSEAYTLTNRSDSEMSWSVSVDQTWVDVSPAAGGALLGTIAGGASLVFDVSTNATVDLLTPGEYLATIAFFNETTSVSTTRQFTLTVDQPIAVVPTDDLAAPIVFTGPMGGPFAATIDPVAFELSSLAPISLDYVVTSNVPWLTVEPTAQTSGTLLFGTPIDLTVSASEQADMLAVGEYTASIDFTWTDTSNANLSRSVARKVELVVRDSVVVAGAPDPWIVGPALVPGALPTQPYLLSNDSPLPVEVLISTDVTWLDIDLASVEVLPGIGMERVVTVSLNDSALTMFDGIYIGSVLFENTVTGKMQCRTVELTIVENLSIAPFGDFAASGIAGGEVSPSVRLFQITNVLRDGAGPIDWAISSDAAWLLFNGNVSASGTLADGETAGVLAYIDPAVTAGLAAGEHIGVISITDNTNAEVHTRMVRLTLVTPVFALTTATIAPTNQLGGPTYAYDMTRFHTTNAEYIAFLNDAKANADTERGQYMFFDTVTGDVYVNPFMIGQSGDDPTTRTVKMFAPAKANQIQVVAGVYGLVPGAIDFAQHPVTGVSWFGAVKYCNWLTLEQGMATSERCYTEGSDTEAAAWRPVSTTTANWTLRDLDDSERIDLVQNYRGYRLPMDDGYGNPAGDRDAPDDYNEWYQAAAWNVGLQKNMVYGFGRDFIGGSDANYLDSGDPMDNGTTPVGYYDGSVQGGVFSTKTNENSFGLADMTGNVLHWMQGRFEDDARSLDFRVLRGGSWSNTSTSLFHETQTRAFHLATHTDATIGFRVVRSMPLPTGDVNGDGLLDQIDFVAITLCLSGTGNVPLAGCLVIDTNGDGAIDLRDFAAFQNGFNPAP